MAHRGVQDDDVKSLRMELQKAAVSFLEGGVRDALRKRPGPRDEDCRRIDARRLGDARPSGERAGHCAGATADFENDRLLRELDLGEVCAQHRLLPGIGKAKLNDIGEPSLRGGNAFRRESKRPG